MNIHHLKSLSQWPGSMDDKSLVVLEITREEVQGMKFNRVKDALKHLERLQLKQSLDIIFYGYDHMVEEVFEIEEIRKWVKGLFQRFPYILYHASSDMGTHERLLICRFDFSSLVIGEKLNAIQLEEKYESPEYYPKMEVVITISKASMGALKKATLQYGRKIGDIRGANKVVKEMEDIISEKTL